MISQVQYPMSGQGIMPNPPQMVLLLCREREGNEVKHESSNASCCEHKVGTTTRLIRCRLRRDFVVKQADGLNQLFCRDPLPDSRAAAPVSAVEGGGPPREDLLLRQLSESLGFSKKGRPFARRTSRRYFIGLLRSGPSGSAHCKWTIDKI